MEKVSESLEKIALRDEEGKEDDDGEDDLSLRADTRAALEEFLREMEEQNRLEEEMMSHPCSDKGNIKFEENWQLSQFWYSSETISDLTAVCKKLLKEEIEKIGLLSCPSIYTSVKNMHKNVTLFEYDKRFAAYGTDFVFYDFNDGESEEIERHREKFDILVVDPPFLSEECIEKISKIVKKLSNPQAKIILCSGKVVEPWARKYLDLQKCKYEPKHERNLGNEFASYCNFALDDLL